MKQLEVQEVFSLDSYSVIKAQYGDSNYYVAGKHDITPYVKAVVEKTGTTIINKTVLELGLQLFFRHNPNKAVLSVKTFDLVLLDDKNTSAEYVIEMCIDLFNFSPKRATEVVNALNGSTHSYTVGTFTEEMCLTYCALIENGNAQVQQNLGFDYIPTTDKPESYEAGIATLETLIRRDYPNDI